MQKIKQATEEVTAEVFKQYQLKWKEIIKASILAGIATIAATLYQIILNQHIPTLAELKLAAIAGVFTMFSALAKYFFNPTTTVIQGQVEPKSTVLPFETVVTTDTNKI